MYTIIPYDHRYRDDMIFLVLEAKDALGRLPRLNPDLMDIPGTYLAQGDPFWLAINEQDRVVGCMGYHAILGGPEYFESRSFYPKHGYVPAAPEFLRKEL